MRYGRLGDSGLLVSAVCLGGNSWGAAGRRAWAPFGKEESRPFFRRALDLGINFFDTADAYNDGDSESIVGECLLGYAKRDDVVICTKVGHRLGNGPNDEGLGRKHILKSIDAQLKRLDTDYIDLYLMHLWDRVTPVEETLDALTSVVKAGKVRYIGGSNFPAWVFSEMLVLADLKGYARPVAMQNLYNLVQREEEREMIPLCQAKGVALTPYSPNARGFLAGNAGAGTERAKKDAIAQKQDRRDCDHEILAVLGAIAAAHGKSPAQIAMAWLWAKGITAPVIGATRLYYLDEAAGAVEIKLTGDEIARLEAPYVYRGTAPL